MNYFLTNMNCVVQELRYLRPGRFQEMSFFSLIPCSSSRQATVTVGQIAQVRSVDDQLCPYTLASEALVIEK